MPLLKTEIVDMAASSSYPAISDKIDLTGLRKFGRVGTDEPGYEVVQSYFQDGTFIQKCIIWTRPNTEGRIYPVEIDGFNAVTVATLENKALILLDKIRFEFENLGAHVLSLDQALAVRIKYGTTVNIKDNRMSKAILFFLKYDTLDLLPRLEARGVSTVMIGHMPPNFDQPVVKIVAARDGWYNVIRNKMDSDGTALIPVSKDTHNTILVKSLDARWIHVGKLHFISYDTECCIRFMASGKTELPVKFQFTKNEGFIEVLVRRGLYPSTYEIGIDSDLESELDRISNGIYTAMQQHITEV